MDVRSSSRRAEWFRRQIQIAGMCTLMLAVIGAAASGSGLVHTALAAPAQVADQTGSSGATAPIVPETAALTRSMWHGQIAHPANVRTAPRLDARIVRELEPATPVDVLDWVAGEAVEPDNPTWAEIAPGEFVYGMLLRPGTLPKPISRPDAPSAGRWIDVDTTRQIATAYEGSQPVHTTFVSTGRPGWETPPGVWPVQRRVERETMDGGTLAGQGPLGLGATYHVENVRWTQYFTADGSALHENYWRDPTTFGIPGSHGCVGMPSAEAQWFWNWADLGTLVVVHAR